MSHNLDSRQVRIALWLLDQTRPKSTAALAEDLGLSQRVVRYRLNGVETYLRSRKLTLTKQAGVGLLVFGDFSDKDAARHELADESEDAYRVFARDERIDLVRALLLDRAPDNTTMEQLQVQLEVSKTSARRDTLRCEPWFAEQSLVIARRPGVGMAVVGSEGAIRRATVKLILEAIPDETLTEATSNRSAPSLTTRVSAGMREYMMRLPLYACAQLVQLHTNAGLRVQNDVMLPLYMAVTAVRLADGRTVALDAGQLRSLMDHPVFATATSLAAGLADITAGTITEEEIAGMTEFLLGVVALEDSGQARRVDETLVNEVLSMAADQLHPVLADDVELRRGLSQHFDRLAVRISYGLPVHNPLLRDVRRRYPEVHAVARLIGEIVEGRIGRPIPEDEIGFITMYLSGAMERTHLWPRRRAVVVCPSGMATVWILVSRIQAEFPHLEIAQVVSAHSYDGQDLDADLVISTVPVSEARLPVVVVNALLNSDDIRSIARHLYPGVTRSTTLS